MRRNNLGILFASAAILSGCATTPQIPAPAPMPADVGWSAPRVETSELPLPLPRPPRPAGPAEQLLFCDEGTPVKVQVGVKSGLAIQFEPEVYVAEVKWAYEDFVPTDDEDKEPWKAMLGKPGGKYPIVYLNANRAGMTTSFMIPTNRGLCLVDARSVESSRVRVVRASLPPLPIVAQKPPLLPEPRVPTQYHGGYVIDPSEGSPVWKPATVVDNGHKTFVVFPRNLSVMPAPMARMISSSGPEMINPVMVGHVMVLEHLVPQMLELRLGTGEHAEVVRITRGTPTTISCPGAPECPTWHDRLAGR